MIGVQGVFKLNEKIIQLDPHDCLCIFTKGMVEAKNADNQIFGEERLRAVLIENKNAPVSQIRQTIAQTIKQFIGKTPQKGDLAFMLVKRLG